MKPLRIHNLHSPLSAAHADQVSADGHTALVEFDVNGDAKAADKNIDPITNEQKFPPGLDIGFEISVNIRKS